MSEGKIGNTLHRYAGESFRDFVRTPGESDFSTVPPARPGQLSHEVDVEIAIERGFTELRVTQIEAAIKDLAADAVVTDKESGKPLGEVDYKRGIFVTFLDDRKAALMTSRIYGNPYSAEHKLMNDDCHAGVSGGVEQIVWTNTTKDGLRMDRELTPVHDGKVGELIVTEAAPSVADYEKFRAGLETVVDKTMGINLLVSRKGMGK